MGESIVFPSPNYSLLELLVLQAFLCGMKLLYNEPTMDNCDSASTIFIPRTDLKKTTVFYA